MSVSDRRMVVSRTLSAPRELVFECWTKPEHAARWWNPDGADYPNEVRYLEVVKPEKLVYSDRQFAATVRFEECAGRTTVTMQGDFESAQALQQAIQEFGVLEEAKQRMADMEAYVTTLVAEPEPVFALTRIFDAPRELVFQAWSDAERLNQWWGPKGFVTKSLRLDFVPGGVYHYSSLMPNGQMIYGTFLYKEIVAPEKIVFLSGFADADCNLARHPMMPDWPRHILNTLTLEDLGGKTRLSLRGGPYEPSEPERLAFREAVKYLTPGFSGTFDQLEAYLAKEQAGS